MKLQIAVLFFVVCFVLVSCSDDNNNPMVDNENQEPFVITSETEYAVYRAFFEEMYVQARDKVIAGNGSKYIVIKNSTYFNYPYSRISQVMQVDKSNEFNVLPQTYSSLLHRNQLTATIDSTKLALSVPCAVLDAEALEKFFPDGDLSVDDIYANWDGFYETYPGSTGIIQVSRVGFNTEGSEALIYVSDIYHDLAAVGYFVQLTREAGTWTIHSYAVSWVA